MELRALPQNLEGVIAAIVRAVTVVDGKAIPPGICRIVLLYNQIIIKSNHHKIKAA
jgi:hypothetical protein